jgi:carboxypeptidase Q
LLPRYDSLEPAFTADASRYGLEELTEMQQWKPQQADQAKLPNKTGHVHDLEEATPVLTMNKVKTFIREQGAVAIVSTSPRGRDGTLFVQGGGGYSANAPENFTDIVLAYEDYMLLQRLAQHRIPVKLEVDIQTKFHTQDLNGYNVIAEIKGTDPKLKNEVVMIGAHLDSWHASVGATDNAAGCAVMLETVRILKALNIKPRRTIRIALWGGEEQGLLGSKNYVKQHFTDTITHKYNKEGDKVSVYFNLDNGTGRIRGIYLQGNEKVQPIFAKWLQPFSDLSAVTTTLQNTGGTDHLPFDAIGLPAFQFIQDDIEYDTRTHHTNMDSYDHLQSRDLKQAVIVMASFVYNAAQRNEKLPRK